MSYSSDRSHSSFSAASSRDDQDFLVVEMRRRRALERINELYNEILRPNNQDFEEFSLVIEEQDEESVCSLQERNQCRRSSCTTVRKLCSKCQQRVSSCESCNCRSVSVLKTKKVSSNDSENCPQLQSQKHASQTSVICTKPKPFSFVAKDTEWLKAREQKIAKIKETIDQQIDDELKVRTHSKPVPKTTHLPLYNQMALAKKKRKTSRKEKCFEVLNNSKPVELHCDYKNKEISKSSSDITASKSVPFKAKPAPKNILSNKISERLKNKEEVRKMLMTERAKQLKEQSSLPFSERTIPRSSSMINIDNYAKTDKDYSKKNISEITKRLYAIKCNNALNSWNEKVSTVKNTKKLEDPFPKKIENKIPIEETMPFLFFPVRMSNAALLREKQIREKMLAKNGVEKKTDGEESIKKKINHDLAMKIRSLMPSSEREKERNEKVKNYREWQFKRQEEYDKELQEIMMRVAEQSLLLERIPRKDQSFQTEKFVFESDKLQDETDSNESTPLLTAAVDVEKESDKATSPPSQGDETDSNSENLEDDADSHSSSSAANADQTESLDQSNCPSVNQTDKEPV